MSTKILFLITLFLLIFSKAQDHTSKHLTFKNVPIDGTLADYILKMKKNGLTHISTDDGKAILQGDFAGYKDCHVGVSTLKMMDLVSKIAVIFPEKETWSSLSDNYFNLKKMLSEKYGQPSDVLEKFVTKSYSQPEDDSSKMSQVKFDNCKYYSIWETDKGQIQLSIEHNGVVSCFVELMYFDKINHYRIYEKAKDDL